MFRKIYYSVSPDFRFFLRKFYYFPVDFYEWISGKRGKGTPKKGDIFIGRGDFRKQGIHQLELLKHHIHLNPDDHVLDVGCGIGRSALPLTEFLSTKGSYDGFDPVKKGIDWCEKNIAKHYKNFKFKYIPLHNQLYNESEVNASSYRFPYEDNSFDKVFLFSVFTHMKTDEIRNYLNEIQRVMKPGGMCLATFFIYSCKEDFKNEGGFEFPILRDGYRLLDKNLEEANIAVEFENLSKMADFAGLQLEKMIDGFWKTKFKKEQFNNFQDIILLKK